MSAPSRTVIATITSGAVRRMRRASDFRDVSGDVDGSGAPSHRASRAHVSVLASVIAVLALLLAASASQAKVVTSGFGKTFTNFSGQLSQIGSKGGEFKEFGPAGIAINNTGAGGVPVGTVYTVEENQHRIQRFSPTGEHPIVTADEE